MNKSKWSDDEPLVITVPDKAKPAPDELAGDEVFTVRLSEDVRPVVRKPSFFRRTWWLLLDKART